MASSDVVDRIKDRLNILDVISPYVELHKAGKSFKGKSPFTKEKTPSFFVSPERGMYYCFSTSQGGDMFSFIEKMEGVDFKEALKILANKAGVELVPENPEARSEREKLYAVIEEATKYFENCLLKNQEAQSYLERRQVNAETIKKWRIGYAPGPPEAGWRELRSHLHSHGYQDEILLKAGLIKHSAPGKEPFDVFRGRVMFPLRDQNGKVVAFSGRILAKDSEAPKYVNSPETPLYHKSELLYGYDFAKHHLRQLGFWLVVEGQFDVVMSHQVGYSNTVAVSGTALTMYHVEMLSRLSNKVVLALDADKAGINAMKKAADLMLRRGFDVKVATMPDGADPADLAKTDAKLLKHSVGQATHVIEFLLNQIITHVDDERTKKLKVRDEIVPFLALISNRIDQEHFEGIVADKIGVSKDSIHFEVTRLLEQEEVVKRRVNERVEEVTPKPVQTASRLQSQYAYIKALLQVIPSQPEQQFMQRFLEEISQVTPLPEIVDSTLEAKICFETEREIERLTPVVIRETVVHASNLLRESLLKDALNKARLELNNNSDDENQLKRVLDLQKELQKPKYTTIEISAINTVGG